MWIEIAAYEPFSVWNKPGGVYRKLQPAVPGVVVVVFSDLKTGKRGHIAPCCWSTAHDEGAHELAIIALLFDRPESLMATLLPEGAHGILVDLGLEGGCGGAGGYYHREEFRRVVEKPGLE